MHLNPVDPVNLSVRELRIVRAALTLALDGDDKEWKALSHDDRAFLASDLLDSIPDLRSSVGINQDQEDDPDPDED